MKLTIIVPCFNEEKTLPVFYREVVKTIQTVGCLYEIIFINDGSRDNTLQVLKDLSQQDDHVIYLSFSRNFGKEAAMYAGFCNASGDMVAIMDADLQDPPALLPRMIELLESGAYDSVAARRENRKGEPRIRSWFAKGFYRLADKISESDIVDGARDFRLMKKEMVDAIIAMGEYNRFSKGIFGWVGFRTYWISYENVERVAGETKWSFWSLAKYGVDGIISFSQVPLSLVSWMGIGFTVFSLFMLVLIVLRRLIFGDPVAGWASTVCVIIFIGGIQLFCLGIIGQYIAKIYLESKHRPHYIIAESNKADLQKIR